MHLALYGGSFDPPHNAHLALCLFAAELLRLDSLVISVSNNPFKCRYDASDAERKQMADLLALELRSVGIDVEVSSWELEKNGPSFTVDLVRYIRSRYQYDRLTLLIGEDSFREITSWKSWETLPSLCRIAVFGRSAVPQGIAALQAGPFAAPDVRFIHFDYPLSSSLIRARIAGGLPVSSFLPSSVNAYIFGHGLYRPG